MHTKFVLSKVRVRWGLGAGRTTTHGLTDGQKGEGGGAVKQVNSAIARKGLKIVIYCSMKRDVPL